MGFLKRFENGLTFRYFFKERAKLFILLSIFAYTIAFSSISVFRHNSFETHAWDLGIFTQSLWTTINAQRFFYYTSELIVNPSGAFFGVHFSPILGFILPLYWIFQSPETLLILQSFILSLAAIPIYKLATEKSRMKIVGVIFAIAYLLYPAIHHVNVYEFHLQAFLPLFFGYTIYYLTKEEWSKYFVFVFLALMCEEHVSWIIFFIGLYIGWRSKEEIIEALKRNSFTDRKLIFTISTMVLSLVWYWITLWQRDTFFPVNPATMTEFLGSGNFRILGANSFLEVPILVILRPVNAALALADDGLLKLIFILFLFGPLAFLSIRSPSSLLPAVPFIVFFLFSQSPFHHTLGTQYPAYFVFFIFWAAISGLEQKKPEKVKKLAKIVLVTSLVFFICVSPLFPIVEFLPTNYKVASFGDHETLLSEVIKGIPADASILTQDNIFPHVSHRIDAYVIPNRWIHSGDIREIAVEFVNQTMDRVEYVLVDNKTDSLAYELILLLILKKPQFKLKVSSDNGTIHLYRQDFS